MEHTSNEDGNKYVTTSTNITKNCCGFAIKVGPEDSPKKSFVKPTYKNSNFFEKYKKKRF